MRLVKNKIDIEFKKRILVCPIFTIKVHSDYFKDNELFISKEEWKNNVKDLVSKFGIDDVLDCLLDVLENGPVRAEEVTEPRR